MIDNQLYDLIHSGDLKGSREWLEQKPEDLNGPLADGFSALHVACIFGRDDIVEYLLAIGGLVNLNAHNSSRATPLHLAASHRDEDIATRIALRLIDHGAELNARQSGGQTPLHHAVARGSLKLVRALVHAGADPFLKDEGDRSPSDLARLLTRDFPIEEIQYALKEAFTLET